MKSSTIIRLVILTILVSCTIAPALNIIPASAQSLCDWTEYGTNPIFGQGLGGAKAYYPKVIYDANQFSGHGDNAYYKMWFGSSSGTGYAYSNDGISWTAGANPVAGVVVSANHPLVEYDPGGFGHGVYYKMLYWDPNVSIYSINALRYAESADGINWSNDQPFTQDAALKLVTGLGIGWNRGSYGPCDLIYNPVGFSDNVTVWNNKYVLYYMGTDGGSEFIGLAYSDNATHWKRYGNNPVLSPGTAADWDNTSVGYCTVMEISGSWHMWYSGGPGTNEGIGYATSPDGINWAKHPANPIFHKSDILPWRDDRTYTPWVVYDAANFGGHGDAYPYKMWFSGKSIIGGNYSIGYAYAILVDAGPNQEVCEGGSPISLTGASPPGGTWSGTGVSGSNFDPTGLLPGPYTVTYTYTNAKGCSNSDNKTVTINAKPTATTSSNSPVCIGDTIQLTGGPNGMASYSWTGPGGWTSNLQNPSRNNASTAMAGTYYLSVFNGKCNSDNAAVSVNVIQCGGTGGGTLPPAYTACPLTLASDMQGTVATVKMTKDGVLCAICVARDISGKHTLQLDEGTKITSAGNAVPLILRFQETSTRPPTPENTVIVGPVYEVNAYSSIAATTPSPVTISPPAMLILTYDLDELPENTSEVFIANYDAEAGWLALASVPGAVAELGKAQGLAGHFSPFAVLAKVTEPSPAKFEVSNLTISPSQAQPDQKVTISLNVANTGGKSGDYSLKLKVDGTVSSTTQVTVAPGTSRTVNFTITGDAAGKHQVEAAGLSSKFEVIKSGKTSQINWWLIGSITGIILVIIAVAIALKR
jgi:hypothetical protein